MANRNMKLVDYSIKILMTWILLVFSVAFINSCVPANKELKEEASKKMIDSSVGPLEYDYIAGNGNTGVVFLHGDPSEFKYRKIIIRRDTSTWKISQFLQEKTGNHVFLVARPGYSDSAGLVGDNPTEAETRKLYMVSIMEAVEGLKAKFSLDKMVLVGFSAGGDAAATAALLKPNLASKVITYGGSFDTDQWAALNGWKNQVKPEMNATIALEAAAPSETEFIIIAGKSDDVVPKAVSETFTNKLQAKGYKVEYIEVEGGHLEFLTKHIAWNLIAEKAK